MKRQVDLNAYCGRVGHDGPRTPTIETLRALHALHPAAIPFEAIDVLLNRGIDLAPQAIDAKLLDRRRGGYCFEHNSLFKRVLTAMGFEVEGLAARVLWKASPETPLPPQTHMALRVTMDGEPWLVDVGFGGCVPTVPLRMHTVAPQPSPHETFRVIPSEAGHRVEACIGEAWEPLYELSPEPRPASDYEPLNWYTSTHPDSKFRRHLIAARATPRARYTLMNARLTTRTADGHSQSHLLNAGQLECALAEIFGLPVEAAWRPLIEHFAATAEAPG